MHKMNNSSTYRTVNVGSPPRKRQQFDYKSGSAKSPRRLPAVLDRKPHNIARTLTPSHKKRRLDASDVVHRSAKRIHSDERKRPSEVSGCPTSKTDRPRHSVVTAPRPSATPGVSRSSRDWPVVARKPPAVGVGDSSVTSSRASPVTVSPAVLVGHWLEIARAIVKHEAKRRLDVSDVNDRSAKRFRPDERERPSEVSGRPTSKTDRSRHTVVAAPRPSAAPGVSRSPWALPVVAWTPLTIRKRRLPVIRPVNLGQWFETTRAVVAFETKRRLEASDDTDRSAKRHRPDDQKPETEVSSGVTRTTGRPGDAVVAASSRSAAPIDSLGHSAVTVPVTATPSKLPSNVPEKSATHIDATVPIRSVVPVPGQSTVTVDATATTPRQRPVAAPKQQSADGPLPLSGMTLLLRRNNTGVLGRDRGDDDDGLPAFTSEGMMDVGGELRLPADPSTLPLPSSPPPPPLPPSRPHVGVIARGPTVARVVWEVGPPVMRADGTPAETAPVQRYEIYVCRDRAAADPASPWLMMAHAVPPPAAATDGSGDLMYRDITGLPTDELLYFVVVPVDVYGRQSDDFDVAGVTLKA